MPTGIFSKGYRKKPGSSPGSPRRKPKGKLVTGPYRSQSSVPKIRKAATKTEHRKVRVIAPSGKHLFDVEGLKVPTKAELRQSARERKAVKAFLTPPKSKVKVRLPAHADIASSFKGSTGESYEPDPVALAVEKDVIKPLQAEGKLPEHPTTGQEIYQKVAEWGPTALTLGPELKAATAGLKAGLAGVESEGVTVGTKKVLNKVLTPAKATSSKARSAVVTRAEQKAALKGTSGAKAAAKRGLSKVTRAEAKADARLARQVTGTMTRKEAARAQGFPLGATKAAAGQTLPVVRGHEQAVLDNPKKTAGTTARAAAGLVTAPVGIAANLGTSVGRGVSESLHAAHVPGFRGYSGKEIAAPTVETAKEQVAFAKQVADVVTADDPDFVKEEVENKLGLILPLTTGLVGGAALKKVTKGRIEQGVRDLAEQVRAGVGVEHGPGARVFENAGQRKAEAKLSANTRLRIRREVGDRAAKVRAHASRAKGSAVIRELPGRTRTGKRRKLKVRTGDLVSFVVRHGLPLDKPDLARAEVKRIGEQLLPLPEGTRLPEDQLHTRDVIAYINEHPNVLKDRHLAIAVNEYRGQAKYARQTPELAADHSERSRNLSVASTHGILYPEERHPLSVRDITRATPEKGKLAKDTLRKEAHQDRRHAKGLKSKAETREGWARAAKKELAVRQRSEPGRQVNDRVVERISQWEAQAKGYREQAAALEDYAKRKQAASKEIDPALLQEFTDEVKATIQKKGLHEPEYVHTGRAREVPVYGATGAKISNVPGKTKFKRGTAEAYGMVREGIGPLLSDSIGKPVARRHIYAAVRDFLDRNEFRVGDQTEFTGTQARELLDAGTVNRRTHVLIPAQLYKRAYDQVKRDVAELPDEEWVGQLRATLEQQGKDAELTGEAGRRYKIVNRAAANEFFDQMTSKMVSPTLAKVNQATAFLILGTSPAWAAMQVLAEYAQAAVAQPKLLNPVYARKLINAYHDMSPHKRQAFESWTGVTNRTLESADQLKLGLESGDMADAAEAFSVMNKTPVGRIIRSIPNSIRAVDQWKGGRIRVMAAAAKIDAEMNGRLNHFLHGVGGLYREGERVSNELKGQPLSKQLEYWADHPQGAAKYQAYLDDVMGNWSALTSNERLAAQLVIFYPFIRMSLRWTLYSFPKQHPIKAAIGLWLGQANANEIKRLLGGDPSFFSGWAQVPLHLGKGETQLIDLSRIAPGSNTLAEVVGTENVTPGQAVERSLQPGIAAAITGITGVDALSGEKLPNAGIHAIGNLMMLSPLTRLADTLTVPKGQKRKDDVLPIFGATEKQDALDKLYAKLRPAVGAASLARKLAFPALPKALETERDYNHLAHILQALEANSSTKRKELAETPGSTRKQAVEMEHAYDAANVELDKLFRKYKIPFEAEDEAFLEHYGRVYYGSSGNKPGPVTIGGKTISQSAVSKSSGGSEVTIGGRSIGAPKKKVKAVVPAKPKAKHVTIGGVSIGG